jgi:hypothetical protein
MTLLQPGFVIKYGIWATAPGDEGKYSIVEHDNHTELAYVLELPEAPGRRGRQEGEASEEIISVIRELPDRKHSSMADMEKSVGCVL